MIGRPALYGLATAAQSGVEGVLDILRTELETTLTPMGVPSVDDLTRDHLLPA